MNETYVRRIEVVLIFERLSDLCKSLLLFVVQVTEAPLDTLPFLGGVLLGAARGGRHTVFNFKCYGLEKCPNGLRQGVCGEGKWATRELGQSRVCGLETNIQHEALPRLWL